MIIKVNGELFETNEKTSLSALAKLLELEGKRYAIEVNEEIISRGEHDNFLLKPNDQVEVVVAIGGG